MPPRSFPRSVQGEVPELGDDMIGSYVLGHPDAPTFYVGYPPQSFAERIGLRQQDYASQFWSPAMLDQEVDVVDAELVTPNPRLGDEIRTNYNRPANVQRRHRQTMDHLEPGMRAPRTEVGQLVHAANRIVEGGDSATNAFFANSVAVARGALGDRRSRKKMRASPFDVMET